MSETFIRRPVLSTVLSFIIIMIGYVCFDRLKTRQFPEIIHAWVSIRTQLHGASSEVVAAQISRYIENSISGIEGIKSYSSSSSLGESKVNIIFNFDRNIDSATNDIRDKLNRIREKLPKRSTEPLIRKAVSDASSSFILSISSDYWTPPDIEDYVNQHLLSEIEATNGVASAEVTGGGVKFMQITLKPDLMRAFQITVEDVKNAIARQNILQPAGYLDQKNREITITTDASLKNEQDFNEVVLKEKDGHLIHLHDVGKATLSVEDRFARTRFNSNPTVIVNVIKQSTSNPLEVEKLLRTKIDKIKKTLPKWLDIRMAYDDTIYIKESLNSVKWTLFEAIILVVLVVFLFLGSFRASFIPVVTIPISLFGSLIILYIFNASLNTITLLSFVLAIGLVVDDAIVVIENIFRYIEKGLTPFKASIVGTKEITIPVIAMTIALAAVYSPIMLAQGTTGKLFTEFALALAGAVIVSGFVALTLSPVMAAYTLKPTIKEYFFAKFFIYYIKKLENLYSKSLYLVVKNTYYRISTLIFIIIFVILSIVVFMNLRKELVPPEDTGIIKIKAQSFSNTNINYASSQIKQIENILEQTDEIEKYISDIKSPGNSTINVTLKNWHERQKSSFQIKELLSKKLDTLPGIRATVTTPIHRLPVGGRGGENSIRVNLIGRKDLKSLKKIASNFAEKLYLPFVAGVRSLDLGTENSEYVININTDKASYLGIHASTIAETLDTLIGGKKINNYTPEGENKRHDVRLNVTKKTKETIENLKYIYVRGSRDNKPVMIPIIEVVNFKTQRSPSEIFRLMGSPSVTFDLYLKDKDEYGNPIKVDLEDATNKIQEIADQYLDQEQAYIDFEGDIKTYKEEQRNIYFIFFLALIFIFLVLCAQYENFVSPLVIMFTVPLSLSGAIISLQLFENGSINIFSQIGLITLIGLITKHGILIVDFANNSFESKKTSLIDAIIEASILRFRPILMTTFAMVLGVLPLALAKGAGAPSRQQIGVVIAGGMSIGTLFTLYILPLIYILFSREYKFIFKKQK